MAWPLPGRAADPLQMASYSVLIPMSSPLIWARCCWAATAHQAAYRLMANGKVLARVRSSRSLPEGCRHGPGGAPCKAQDSNISARVCRSARQVIDLPVVLVGESHLAALLRYSVTIPRQLGAASWRRCWPVIGADDMLLPMII